MRLSANTLVLLGVLLCGGVAVGAATPLGPRAAARATGSAASSCDRDCLDGFIDQYLSEITAVIVTGAYKASMGWE